MVSTHAICNKRSAIISVSEHCTCRATLTIFEWNCGSIELYWPRIMVVMDSGTHMWRWSLHPHWPWDISSLNWSSSPAWLPLEWIRSLFWCTVWPDFSPWWFGVSHVIWKQRVVIGHGFCISWPMESKRVLWIFWSWHCRVELRVRAALCCAETVIKMTTAGSWTRLCQCWWSRWYLVLFFFCVGTICWIMCGKSIVILFLMSMMIHTAASGVNFWFTNIHFYNLDVVFQASVHFLEAQNPCSISMTS